MIDEDKPFRLEEATIEELHRAIKAGRTTCVAIVQHYIERARAFNGVASALVTKDGMPVPDATGAVRGGKPLRFPTQTISVSTIREFFDPVSAGPLVVEAAIEISHAMGWQGGAPDLYRYAAGSESSLRGESHRQRDGRKPDDVHL